MELEAAREYMGVHGVHSRVFIDKTLKHRDRFYHSYFINDEDVKAAILYMLSSCSPATHVHQKN